MASRTRWPSHKVSFATRATPGPGRWTFCCGDLSDLAGGDETAAGDAERHEDYDAFARLLGSRLGEMHAVLARETDNPDFAPVPADTELAQQWAQQAERQLATAFSALSAQQQERSEGAVHDLDRLMAARER